MQFVPCAAEKIAPEPLMGEQEKPKGAISVIIPSEPGKNSKAGFKGLLSSLKTWPHRWTVLSVILILILILIILILIILILIILIIAGALTARKPEPCPAASVSLLYACADDWVRYLEKCYYFSEAEANWDSSQSNCSAHNASLAVIDTPEEMKFMKRYKETFRYWIGLRRDRDESWKWTNGTEFNRWFQIQGEEKCASLDNNVDSSGCLSKDRWICSKPVEKIEGKVK